MKNPIKHIKHMWKDPINTIAEADARKKEIMPWLIGSLAVAVIFCVLGSLVLDFLMIFAFVGIIGAIIFGFMLFIIKKAKEKFKALTCNECNTMAEIKTAEDYAKYVSYIIKENPAKYDGISHPASNNSVVSKIEAKGSASVEVQISLTCPKCGKVKELKYYITPFKCAAVQEKVHVSGVELVKIKLENAVKAVIADYNDVEKRKQIPYSIHSVKNPNYENRTKAQIGTSYIPRYNDVRINYRKDPEEMVEQFFLKNQLDGKIVEVGGAKK